MSFCPVNTAVGSVWKRDAAPVAERTRLSIHVDEWCQSLENP